VQVTFTAAIALPAPGSSLSVQGHLVEGRITFDGPKRFILSADAAEALKVRGWEASTTFEV
jgi:hypothetical protein